MMKSALRLFGFEFQSPKTGFSPAMYTHAQYNGWITQDAALPMLWKSAFCRHKWYSGEVNTFCSLCGVIKAGDK